MTEQRSPSSSSEPQHSALLSTAASDSYAPSHEQGVCTSCGAHLARGDGYKNPFTEFTDDWHAAHEPGCKGLCLGCPVQCGPVISAAVAEAETVTCPECEGHGEKQVCVNDGTHGCSHVHDTFLRCLVCRGEGVVSPWWVAP